MLTMSYNSLLFLVFFTILAAVYLVMPNVPLRKAVIFIGSMIFYVAAAGAGALVIVFATSLVTYFCSVKMDAVYKRYGVELKKREEELAAAAPPAKLKAKEKNAMLVPYRKQAFRFLIAGLVLLFGVLFYTKIGKLLHFESVSSLRDIRLTKILVPLGLSYYTFSAAGYLLDIYWRKTEAEKRYFSLLLCMTYFPIIVQGPISRYDQLMKQFDALPPFNYERVTYGAQLMIWGLYKKVVLADRLTLFTDFVFSDPSQFHGPEVFCAVVANVVVLYADFSGCMDIVTGASQIFGVALEKNFDHPFFSLSAAEFWRRWHITLGAWFKDYVYMPIATSAGFMKWSRNVKKSRGARAGKLASSGVPLLVVWILTGLWHGTGADYVIWGLYWGILIIVETVFAAELQGAAEKMHLLNHPRLHKGLRMLRTFVYFAIGRMITATGAAGSVLHIVGRFFSGIDRQTMKASVIDAGLQKADLLVIAVSVCLLVAVDFLQEKRHLREEIAKLPLVVRWLIYYGGILLIVLWGMYGSAYNASDFVYGGF